MFVIRINRKAACPVVEEYRVHRHGFYVGTTRDPLRLAELGVPLDQLREDQ